MAIDSVNPTQPAMLAIPHLQHLATASRTPPASIHTTTLTIPPSPPAPATTTSQPVKPIPRRDSLDRREALLRGKEGTRRRQRWENDRLLSNPHAIPPTASDWEPHPLHPRRDVPYEFASLYDHPSFVKRRDAAPKHEPGVKMPRALKVRMKKSRGAIGLLKSLEEEVRKFLLGEADERVPEEEDDTDVVEESDEEIVFISKRAKQLRLKTEKVLFESPAGDPAASFSRWLVHSIASYYGLKSWSITSGNPAKRIAYVGLKKDTNKASSSLVTGMPKPLWHML